MLTEIVLLNKYKMTLLYNLENTIYMTFPHIDILLLSRKIKCSGFYLFYMASVTLSDYVFLLQ